MLLGVAFAHAHEGHHELSPLRMLTLQMLKANPQLQNSLSQKDLKKIGNLSPLNSVVQLSQAIITLNHNAFMTNNPENLKEQLSKNPQVLEMLYFQSLQESGALNEEQFAALLQEYTNNPKGELARTLKKQIADDKDTIIAQILEQQTLIRDTAQEMIAGQLHEYTKDLENVAQASIELSVAIKINNEIVDQTDKPLTLDVSPLLKDIKEKAQAAKLAQLTKNSKKED